MLIDYKHLYLPSDCENNCRNCGYGEELLENKGVKKKISKVEDENIELLGKEPLKSKVFYETLKELKKRGARSIKIRTNARLLSTKKKVKEVIKGGARVFEIEIFGPDSKTHNKVTDSKAGFSQMIEGVKHLNGGPNSFLSARVGITRENQGKLKEISDFVEKMGFHRIIFSLKDTDLHLDDLRKELRKCLDKNTANGIMSLTEGVPPCFLGDNYVYYIKELYTDTIWSYTKLEECENCFYRDICPGVKDEFKKHNYGGKISSLKENKDRKRTRKGVKKLRSR